MRRVVIEIVIAETVIDAVESLPPVVGLLVLGLIEFVEETEVHNGFQIAVHRAELGVLLPGGGVGGLGDPCLAHGVEVGILSVEHFHPLCHGLSVGIRIGVHADTVDARSLYPPLTVLDEVAHEMGIALVEVGHGLDKPSVNGFLHILLRSVGVEDGGELIACLKAVVGIIEPVLRRWVEVPGMVVAAMVEDHIHHHLQSTLVAFVDELLIFSVCTEARIHFIVIGGGVSVVRAVHAVVVGPVVFQDRCEPQGSNAKVGEVVEVLLNAGEVTAVAQAWLGAVAGLVAHSLDDIVLRVAVGEAVGHEQVEHVGIGEALVVLATHGAVLERIAHLLAVEVECHLSGLSPLQVQVDEQIVRRVEADDGVHLHAGVVGGDLLDVFHILTIDHELQARVFHPHIPVCGVDAADSGGGTGRSHHQSQS